MITTVLNGKANAKKTGSCDGLVFSSQNIPITGINNTALTSSAREFVALRVAMRATRI